MHTISTEIDNLMEVIHGHNNQVKKNNAATYGVRKSIKGKSKELKTTQAMRQIHEVISSFTLLVPLFFALTNEKITPACA